MFLFHFGLWPICKYIYIEEQVQVHSAQRKYIPEPQPSVYLNLYLYLCLYLFQVSRVCVCAWGPGSDSISEVFCPGLQIVPITLISSPSYVYLHLPNFLTIIVNTYLQQLGLLILLITLISLIMRSIAPWHTWVKCNTPHTGEKELRGESVIWQ